MYNGECGRKTLMREQLGCDDPRLPQRARRVHLTHGGNLPLLWKIGKLTLRALRRELAREVYQWVSPIVPVDVVKARLEDLL